MPGCHVKYGFVFFTCFSLSLNDDNGRLSGSGYEIEGDKKYYFNICIFREFVLMFSAVVVLDDVGIFSK